jgi:hypothetical protein
MRERLGCVKDEPDAPHLGSPWLVVEVVVEVVAAVVVLSFFLRQFLEIFKEF